ncbi:MAG: DUF455 family protein [Acidobacteriota bacterium]|nr:DUF455 family protein [Acidobacteriota bacterium]
MRNIPEGDPLATQEFLHRQMNEEVNSIEITARNLVDFPEAPWGLRMAMARQCWDESRHVDAFRRLFESRGGRVGEFPVLNFQYRIVTNLNSLAGRLTVQNRSFEAAGIDAIKDGIQSYGEAHEKDFVELFEAQLADEVQHVRYANEWVKRLIDEGGARVAFEIARAVAQADAGLKIVAGGALTTYPIDDEVRREAGFTDEEIDVVRTYSES